MGIAGASSVWDATGAPVLSVIWLSPAVWSPCWWVMMMAFTFTSPSSARSFSGSSGASMITPSPVSTQDRT